MDLGRVVAVDHDLVRFEGDGGRVRAVVTADATGVETTTPADTVRSTSAWRHAISSRGWPVPCR